MKKDVYVLIGIGALLISGLIIGARFYQNSQKESSQENVKTHASELLSPESPSLGPLMARVSVTEFLDPECEACSAMHPIVKKILSDYEGKIHYQVRYMPFHGNSLYAASLLEAAREQGKYWEALDLLFKRQPEWADHHAPKPELLTKFLGEMGLDVSKLEEVAKKQEIRDRIERDEKDGQNLGVRGTPTFFVNGKMLERLGDAELRGMIDEALK